MSWFDWSNISHAALVAAHARIRAHVRCTPLEYSSVLSACLGCPVWLKLESQQLTGSFKLRGATYALMRLSDAQRTRGVVTASTGNHGRALAFAAREQGIPVRVYLSHDVPQNKVLAIRALGAQIELVGSSQDAALDAAWHSAETEGLTFLPPFDHPDIITGQSSLGLELLEQLPDVRQVVIPLSGGGLFSGVALALKTADPSIRLHGVSMQAGAAMHASLQAGHPVTLTECETLADSLRGGIGLDNHYSFAITQAFCDHLHLLDETAIADAIRHAYFQEHQVIEGAAAVPIAALLQGLVAPVGATVVLISGRNIDTQQHLRILNGANTND